MFHIVNLTDYDLGINFLNAVWAQPGGSGNIMFREIRRVEPQSFVCSAGPAFE
jgi:hypothetical protein